MRSTSAALTSIQAVSPVSAWASVAWAQALAGRQRTAAQRARPGARTVGRSMDPDCRIDALRVPQGRGGQPVTPEGLPVFRSVSMRDSLLMAETERVERPSLALAPDSGAIFRSTHSVSAMTLVLLVGCATASSGGGGPAPGEARSRGGDPLRLPAVSWPAEEQAVHVLNRLAYGPSPADLRELEAMGASAWIARQLVPADIDDAAVEKRLADFPSLSMSTAELVARYPRAKKVAEAKGISMEGKSAEAVRAELLRVVEPFQLPRQVGAELVAARLI